jgi:ERCC4-related helicase
MSDTRKRPKVKLVGEDGNAFAILGRCKEAARKAGWTKEQIDEVMKEMRSGDYNHLLATAMDHFDVR